MMGNYTLIWSAMYKFNMNDFIIINHSYVVIASYCTYMVGWFLLRYVTL